MSDETASRLREQMAEIRARAHSEARELEAEARQFLDWKQHVRAWPWATIAVGAAVGYFLVPRRAKPVGPSLDSIRDLLAHQRPVFVPRSPPPPSLTQMAVRMASGVALKAGMNLATHLVQKYRASKAEPAPAPEPQESHYDRRRSPK